MDLPTYTNIWRIEKRLYKLYDLRLPMPLPIVWIGVFVGVLAPWSLLLMLLHIPFAAPWHVLYLVPPGVVTWLSTRPVIESKRLTELLQSQLRYVGEPRAWCRMAPTSEPETVTFAGRVWRVTPKRVKAPRKARQPQRKRRAELELATQTRRSVGAEPVTGPRQVRPAVAAAAAAAAQAPVAEPRPARPGWGSVTRRGTAPALGAELAVQPPALQPEPSVRPDKTLAMGSRPAQAGSSADKTSGVGPRAGRTAGSGSRPTERPLIAVQGDEGGEDVVLAAGKPVDSGGDDGARVAGKPVDRSGEDVAPTAGKPIDTEALRRLRRLAASADTTVSSESTRAETTRAETTRARAVPSVAVSADTTASTEAARTEAARTEAAPSDVTRVGAAPSDATPSDVIHSEDVTRAEAPHSEAASREAMAGGAAEAGGSSGMGRSEGSRSADGAGREDERATGPEEVRAAGPEEVRAAGVDEVARDQHRKGKPPRQSPPLVFPDVQRLWPPLSPDSKPVRFIRPVTRDDEAQRAGTAPVGRDEPATTASLQGPETTASVHEIGPAKSERARQEHGPAKGERGRQGTGPVKGERAASASDRDSGTYADEAAVSRAYADEAVGIGPFESEQSEQSGQSGQAVRPPAARQITQGPTPGERVRRVESVVGRDSGGWRRIAQVVVGGGSVRTDGSEIDEARTRAVFSGSRRVVVLGCTGGAGQSTTALMLGHTFAQYRDDRVVAIDANIGGNTLTSRIDPETPETLASLLAGLERVSGYLTMRGYTTRTGSGLEVIGADTDAEAEQRLSDRTLFSDHRLGQAMHLLDRHYKLAVMDPAAALAARVLPYADQLVLVVPASEEAPEAVAMTYEWLDGHGCADLRRRAVMVVNGVSRRSMADVEQAESVASGRCRAIVRVPWEDDLAPGGDGVVDPGQLRPAGRRAYLALAGVVVAGFAAQTVRPSEEELASDPPGTRIGER
ncbi:TcpE family conjugal transfer membrane protein [Nonomuraea sp. NPDC049129]|uniref:TcpE family conjugal transfer membrane protein n=1 Tax=Nonomuraea sp. NPDC049129 TaxID=3155272 RepID=UPI0033E4469C